MKLLHRELTTENYWKIPQSLNSGVLMLPEHKFIGDFEVKWRMDKKGTLYVKAYNQTNDRYFTKATLNTQGLGLSWRHDFESIRRRLKKKEDEKAGKQ